MSKSEFERMTSDSTYSSKTSIALTTEPFFLYKLLRASVASNFS